MGEVVKKTNDAELAFDKILIKQALEKDKENEQKEIEKKRLKRERNQEVN